MLNQIYDEGMKAYFDGKDLKSNPYRRFWSSHPTETYLWESGFKDAKEEQEKVCKNETY